MYNGEQICLGLKSPLGFEDQEIFLLSFSFCSRTFFIDIKMTEGCCAKEDLDPCAPFERESVGFITNFDVNPLLESTQSLKFTGFSFNVTSVLASESVLITLAFHSIYKYNAH